MLMISTMRERCTNCPSEVKTTFDLSEELGKEGYLEPNPLRIWGQKRRSSPIRCIAVRAADLLVHQKSLMTRDKKHISVV